MVITSPFDSANIISDARGSIFIRFIKGKYDYSVGDFMWRDEDFTGVLVTDIKSDKLITQVACEEFKFSNLDALHTLHKLYY